VLQVVEQSHPKGSPTRDSQARVKDMPVVNHQVALGGPDKMRFRQEYRQAVQGSADVPLAGAS